MGFVKTLGFTRVNASIVASPEMIKSSLLFTNDETIASNSSMFFFVMQSFQAANHLGNLPEILGLSGWLLELDSIHLRCLNSTVHIVGCFPQMYKT